MQKILKSLISIFTILMVTFSPFSLLTPGISAATTWPTSWNSLNDDSDTDCSDAHRNVLDTYYVLDSNYIYLRLNLQSGPKDGPQHLYKWFLDANKDASVKGTSIEKYEYLVVYRDQKIYLCDSSDDKLSKCSQITDPNILDYRKTGNYLDISIKLASVGGVVKSVWWITDSNENNLNQQSNGNKDDWPDFGGADIPFIPIPYCGDGEVNQPSEQCDDGNNVSGDGCSAICTIEVCTPGTTASCDTGELGVCAVGTKTCNDIGAWGNCVRNTNPSAEVCDNLDNDCDGETDENLTRPTSNQYGLCAGNIEVCEAGQWVESPNNYTPTDEVCDGQDDENCDGTVDEGCSCVNGATRPCGPQTEEGECAFGTQICENGQWGECVGAVYPNEETCDGLDNDCDGETDENLTRPTSNQYGLCAGNIEVCEAGQWVESPNNYTPTDEVCEGQLDENCDGNIDEGDVCPSIYGVKYHDKNGNGQMDEGEEYLAGWLIKLYQNQNLIAETTTTENGYTFSNLLLGDYQVCEINTREWFVTDPWEGLTINPCKEVQLENEDVVVNFGNFNPVFIGGYKFNDLDQDGEKDENEEYLDGWVIRLYKLGEEGWESVGSQPTGSTGEYGWSRNGPGTYFVCEVISDHQNWIQTYPNEQTGVSNQSGMEDEALYCHQVIVNESGKDYTDLNFGNYFILTPTPTPTPEPSPTPTPQPGGGGGGGAGGGAAPIEIYDEAVAGVTADSVTITWKTRLAGTSFPFPASSQVIYGRADEDHTLNFSDNTGIPPKYGYANTTIEYDTITKVVNHSVTITGLTPGTTYFARCVSRSPLAISTELTFTTAGVAGVVTEQPTVVTEQPTGAGEEGLPSEEQISPEGVGGEQILETLPLPEEVITPEVKGVTAAAGFAWTNLCWLLLALIIILLIIYFLAVFSEKKTEEKKGWKYWILPLATIVLTILYCIFCPCGTCSGMFCCKVCWILLAVTLVLILIDLFWKKKK